MIKKTGREIHKLRKAKLGPGELDKHMFQEKMAFLTTSLCQEVPPLLLNEADTLTAGSVSSRSSTLKHAATLAPVDSLCSMRGMTAVSGSGSSSGGGLDLDLETEDSSSSSTCSTPTPHLKPTVLSNGGSLSEASASAEADSNLVASERFSYEIDPDIGVIV